MTTISDRRTPIPTVLAPTTTHTTAAGPPVGGRTANIAHPGVRASVPIAASDWYKDAIIYELHVRAFADSDSDGIGDFPGLTERLDYLQDLGVTALWLLPFYPSPLRDDGYDIADYTDVNPSYGTLDDFKRFLRAAHARDLRVITELVLNHTSDQHPWFQRARRAPRDSPERAFYVWSDTPDPYRETRIIFKDFETSNWAWDPVAHQYYWHRFYSHQPDLNFDNEEVRRTMIGALDFWLDLGVDGVRLDAVPYLYEREGTSCENLPETHEFLRSLRRHVDEKYGDRMLLAEANQWPEDAVAYFGRGTGDECHTAFHFPLMPRLFMSIRTEDRFPVLDILEQTPAIPETAQWLLFLRNHDELTLEMVTDEERDYMYRVYASDPRARINLGIRHRLAPLLGNDRRRIELMNGLLLSLPGTPVIYYGDEIGMGDNIYLGDRDSVRTPMQWSADRNAGFSRTNPQRLYLPLIQDPSYHPDAVNVENQLANRDSLLWWMRRMIALRRRYPAFGRGNIQFLRSNNPRALAFLRAHGDDRILVVANLSRFAQSVEIDLSEFVGHRPIEIMGQSPFPRITKRPYVITVGPHGFYWLRLESPQPLVAALAAPQHGDHALPVVPSDWHSGERRQAREALEQAIAATLPRRRWYRGKARQVSEMELLELIPVGSGPEAPRLGLVEIRFVAGEPETYVLPLRAVSGETAHLVRQHNPQAIIADIAPPPGEPYAPHLLVDALHDPDTTRRLLEDIHAGAAYTGRHGRLVFVPTSQFDIASDTGGTVAAALAGADQSNTSVRYDERFILKIFRVMAEGQNPDVEIGHHLTRVAFPHTPPVLGTVEYHRRGRPAATLALLQAFVRNEGDAWAFTIDHLRRANEWLITHPEGIPEAPDAPGTHVLQRVDQQPPAIIIDSIGPYLASARLLGQRTAQLHLALAAVTDDAAFTPERLTPFSQRSLYQSLRSIVRSVFPVLSAQMPTLDSSSRPDAERVLSAESAILARFEVVRERLLDVVRIRIHGDFHLGQVLRTGSDFTIIDFEGEPARPLGERRLKRSPLRDVAGMLRSFHYAAHAALLEEVQSGTVPPDRLPRLEAWADCWTDWISAAYLRAYLDAMAVATLLPRAPADLRAVLDAHLLEKAVYELGYELNNRPDWVRIPLRGILSLLATTPEAP